MELVFERQSLYREIWSTPISTLAKKYRLSDIALRKVCIALDIPLPGKGYWQKLAAGHQIPVPPLHPTTGRTKFVCRQHNVLSGPALPTSDQEWLEQRLAFERDPQNAIVVPTELTKYHPLVAAAVPAIRAQIADLQRSRDYEARPRKRGEPWKLPPTFKPKWRVYEQRGVMEPDEDLLPTRVSFEATDRALRIWNALLKACEARGMRVSASSRLLTIRERDGSVGLRMSEKVTRITRPAAWGGDETVSRNATGQLRIFAVYLGETKFEDSAKRPLEAQLNDILTWIYRTIASQRAGRARAAEKRRLDAEAAQLREEELRRQGAAEAEAKAERERELLLAAEAAAWHQAQSIREYVEHVQAAATASGHCATYRLREWSHWAIAVADDLDPTNGRLRDTLGDN